MAVKEIKYAPFETYACLFLYVQLKHRTLSYSTPRALYSSILIFVYFSEYTKVRISEMKAAWLYYIWVSVVKGAQVEFEVFGLTLSFYWFRIFIVHAVIWYLQNRDSFGGRGTLHSSLAVKGSMIFVLVNNFRFDFTPSSQWHHHEPNWLRFDVFP